MGQQYGHYLENGVDFRITERNIPRNWYNYLWNDHYVTFTSQTSAGGSFLQGPVGRRIKLVKDRGLFIKEGDIRWGIGGLPVNEKLDAYHCTHKQGTTDIYTEKNGIATTVGFLVPRDLACELWSITVTNTSERARELTVVSFCNSEMDGKYSRQGYNTTASHYDEARDCLYFSKRAKGWDKERAYGFMTVSEHSDGYAGAYNAIVGPYGSFSHPVILETGANCLGGCGEKLAYAMEKKLTLAPGGTKQIVFLLGIAWSLDEADDMRRKYATAEFYNAEREEVLEKFQRETDGVSINTPDTMLNSMFEWLKHQSNLGSRWARVRHNGFRDMTSDTDCFACVNPELALERLKRILSYQYSDGYAPRTFIDGEIRPNNFSDNTVWINFTASSVLKELGRKEILDIEIPYNDGTVGTMYEHLYRSVDFLYHFRGLHNLVKIWGGDWNDCMDKVGMEGRGVSVWLSIAWYRANRFFADIARIYGKKEDEALAKERGEEMRAIIEEWGWDGEYYLDAYDDHGSKIGSHENEEGKIFLIPQIWAVFSGVSAMGRERIAMEAVDKYLTDPLGTLVSAPAYTKWNPNIGAITEKYPGIHENGGVYLHTIAWKIAAEAMLKRADKVEEGINTILPFRNKVVDGRAEPYIMCNSYFGKQTGYRYGTPGQSWRTAAGQWFQKAMVNYVFGLLPEMEGLTIDPCLPPSWKTASIDKKFRCSHYHITYENGGTTLDAIYVNGERIEGNLLPLIEGDVEVRVVTK